MMTLADMKNPEKDTVKYFGAYAAHYMENIKNGIWDREKIIEAGLIILFSFSNLSAFSEFDFTVSLGEKDILVTIKGDKAGPGKVTLTSGTFMIDDNQNTLDKEVSFEKILNEGLYTEEELENLGKFYKDVFFQYFSHAPFIQSFMVITAIYLACDDMLRARGVEYDIDVTDVTFMSKKLDSFNVNMRVKGAEVEDTEKYETFSVQYPLNTPERERDYKIMMAILDNPSNIIIATDKVVSPNKYNPLVKDVDSITIKYRKLH